MLTKQKRSIWATIVAYVVVCSVVTGAWITSRWLTAQLSGNLPEPITPAPAVYAQSVPVEPEYQPEPKIDSLEVKLQAIVDDFAASQSGKYGIYVEHLPTNTTAEHRSGMAMTSASLYKLFVANEAFKMIEQHRLAPEMKVENKRNLTLSQCLEIMIIRSDNKCGVALQHLTGTANNPLPAMEQQGFKDTDLRGYFPQTSARDVARMYKNLLKPTYLKKSGAHQLLELLSRQEIRDRLPQGLPAGTEVMHKTGDLKGYAHDGGIIRTKAGEYILVVMSEPDSATSLPLRYSHIAELTASIHQQITAYEKEAAR